MTRVTRLTALLAALALACAAPPEATGPSSAFEAYVTALEAGDPAAAERIDGVVQAELASEKKDPIRRRALARLRAQRHGGEAAKAEGARAIAHDEIALALLDHACPTCTVEPLPHLLRLSRVYEMGSDEAALEELVIRMRQTERGLSVRRISDWAELKALVAVYERLRLRSDALRIAQAMLRAQLEMYGPDHSEVAVWRHRVSRLKLEPTTPPVGAGPP